MLRRRISERLENMEREMPHNWEAKQTSLLSEMCSISEMGQPQSTGYRLWPDSASGLL